MSYFVFSNISKDFPLTAVFTVDATILTHNHTKSEVIRLGLCAN
jgi:hypothetical protein